MIIACITGNFEGGFVSTYKALCHDGSHVIEVRPSDPHVSGWEDYQDAYDALWEVYPQATLVGPENWFLNARMWSQKETGEIA